MGQAEQLDTNLDHVQNPQAEACKAVISRHDDISCDLFHKACLETGTQIPA